MLMDDVELIMEDHVDEEPVAVEEPTAEVKLDDGLLSDEAASSAASALSKLSSLKSKPAPSTSNISVGTISLDEIVRQEVRPIVKEWLDNNLPGLVEKLVQKEIERLHGGKED